MRRKKHGLPTLPEFPRSVSFPGGGGGIVVPYLIRATAADWNGTQLVGTGATFTQATPSLRPSVVGDALRFNGTTHLLTANVSLDMMGRTLMYVATPGVSDAAQDAFVSMVGVGNLSVCAQTIGSFLSQLRTTAGFGAGITTITPGTPDALTLNQTNTRHIAIVRVRPDNRLEIVNGSTTSAITTLTSGAKGMTSIRLGAGPTANYMPVDLFELAVIDSVDDAVIHAAAAEMAARWSVTPPIVTQFLARRARIFGDSIAAGIGGSGKSHLELSANRLLCDTDGSALADAQVSIYGFVSPAQDAKIAASFARVTANAGLYTGQSLILVHSGANDWVGNTPLGSAASVNELEFNGGFNVGANNIDSLAPGLPVVFCGLYYTSYRGLDDGGTNGIGLTRNDYRAALSARCAERGYTYVEMGDLGITLANSATYLSDTVHPNDAGYELGRARLQPVLQALP